MRTFERKRKQIVSFLADHLRDASDSRAALLVRAYCRKRNIPATNEMIQDVATEAVRRRMIEKFKELNQRVKILEQQMVALNDKVNQHHP